MMYAQGFATGAHDFDVDCVIGIGLNAVVLVLLRLATDRYQSQTGVRHDRIGAAQCEVVELLR